MPQGLALTLLVLGIFAYYHDFSLALNDFALLANFLYRRSDFHCVIPPKIIALF
jgi:hypothetical protein